jgi:hypothetical protein
VNDILARCPTTTIRARLEAKMKPGSSRNITLVVLSAAILVAVVVYSAAPLHQLSDAPIVDYGDHAMRYIGALFGRHI